MAPLRWFLQNNIVQFTFSKETLHQGPEEQRPLFVTLDFSIHCTNYLLIPMVSNILRHTNLEYLHWIQGKFATRESISVAFDIWVTWVPHSSNSLNYLATNAKSPSVQKVKRKVAFIATICWMEKKNHAIVYLPEFFSTHQTLLYGELL